MLWPKKNSYKDFDNEKKFLRLENSPPPAITILMVRPLISFIVVALTHCCFRKDLIFILLLILRLHLK